MFRAVYRRGHTSKYRCHNELAEQVSADCDRRLHYSRRVARYSRARPKTFPAFAFAVSSGDRLLTSARHR